MPDFAHKQIIEFTGLKSSEIAFHVDSGLVKPIQGAGGRGRHRRYSQKNLLEFLLIKEFLTWKMTIKKTSELLQKVMSFDLTQKYLQAKEDYKDKPIQHCYFLNLIKVGKNGNVLVRPVVVFGSPGNLGQQSVLSVGDLGKNMSCLTINFGELYEKAFSAR